MTRYYFDDMRQELVATWETGVGGRASRVATIPDEPELEPGLSIGAALADQLTHLSSGAWRTYTHGGRFVEAGETNTEAWRLAKFREDFTEAAGLISEPGNPHMLPYSPVLAPAKSAGHLLADVASESVTNAVLDEVETELNAVVSAELGDLTGRGAQAVVLTRWSSSPTQVQAAWDLLDKDPLGCTASMKTTLDPTSAAVAAAAWLLGAAEIAAEESGTELALVVADADNIEALPVTIPMEVLDRLEQGETPTKTVSELVAEAQRVSEGLFPELAGVSERLTELMDLAERAPDARDVLIAEAKICLLDPSRPGPDLLEDLLTGIWGCFLVWSEHTWEEREPEGLAEDDEITPEQSTEMNRAAREQFSDLLREAMSEVDRFSI